MPGNIYSLSSVRNEQTKNTNRSTIKFFGLERVIQNAFNPPLPAVQARAEALKTALTNSSYPGKHSEALELSLLSFTMPKIEVEREDLWRFNDSRKAVTRFAPLEEMTATFYDYVNGSSSAILMLWNALIADKSTGAIGYKQDYVCSAQIHTYGPTAPAEVSPDPIEIYEISGLYPASVDLGEFSYENAAARKVTAMLIVDNVYPVLVKGRNAAST